MKAEMQAVMDTEADELETWSAAQRARLRILLISRFAEAWPPRFRGAAIYPISTGGKRFRPLLALAVAEALGQGPGPALDGAAAAVELVHTYSLVHDDLPCMDDDDERRGHPTVHRVYGDGPAVLVGDALLTEAFRLLATLPAPAELRAALVAELAEAAGHLGMIGGQAADVGMGGPVVELEALVQLHRGKTGALIRAAGRMGAMAAGAGPAELAAVTQAVEAIGLAFQLADDVLDEDQDAGEEGVPSYVKLLGREETERRARALLAEALDCTAGLPSPARLHQLFRYVVERDH
jgi:geranylgeranyl pyrophosphate synthase